MIHAPKTIKLSCDAVYNLHDAICNHIIYDKGCDQESAQELRRFRSVIDAAIATELFIEITISKPTRKESNQ